MAEGANQAGVLAAALPAPEDPAKAAAAAEAEASRLANLEALKAMNVIRRWCFRISTHEDFEFVVFVLIFINIVTLAMYNPLKTSERGYNFILERTRKATAGSSFLSRHIQLDVQSSCRITRHLDTSSFCLYRSSCFSGIT